MSRYSKLFFLIIILILTLFMVINPQETVKASTAGLKLWLLVLVPALFPFFIVSDLMINLGFVHFLGVVLEPIMRPLFRLPGCSSLVIVMGFTSGFPVGAILTRRLYEDKMLTANEAERLVSFTNNSSPLFILGAVGIGMFGSAAIGYLLAASHYLSNLLVGILWRFKSNEPHYLNRPTTSRLKKGLKALIESQNSADTNIGTLISSAIKNSLNNILAISGFIIVFSIIARIFAVWGLMDILAQLFTHLFAFMHVTYQVAYGLGMGLLEITIGANNVANALNANILQQLIIVSIIIAFSGLSIITQVMSIMAGTPVRLSFYLLSRFLQVIFSVIITFTGYHLFIKSIYKVTALSLPQQIMYSFNAWHISLYCFAAAAVIITILAIGSFFIKS